MKKRNQVPNLDHIGSRKPAGKRLEEPPPEAFLNPGERPRFEDEDETRDRREYKSRERPSN